MRSEERETILDLLEAAFGLRQVFDLYMRYDPALSPEDMLIATRDGQPASCVQIFTKRVRIRGETILMGGIGSVGTHPDHRSQGLASELMRRADQEMQRKGMVFSLLFTGRLSFYERLGWISIPQGKLALHVARDATTVAPPGAEIRPYREADRAQVEHLYEQHTRSLETSTVRDRAYWDGQLRYAGDPDEDFYVAERGGWIVAYARKVVLEWASIAMEYAREPGAAAELAALLVTLAPREGALLVPWAADTELERALEPQSRRLDHFPDPEFMWRVLDRERLARLSNSDPSSEDRALLEPLVAGPRALYWPSDRF
jgi:predicted N-acetyltransferase YhbS